MLPLAVAAVVALPSGSLAGAPATTAAPTLKGELDTGGTVAFELRRKKDSTRVVMRWRWHNLPIVCGEKQKPHVSSGYFNPAPEPGPKWPTVTDRGWQQRADLEQPGREGFAEVKGSFPQSWRKAKGTFQVSGDTSNYDDCESGVVNWTAKRV